MNTKQNDESMRIRHAHNTRSLLETIGVHMTGNEFIGLVKNSKNIRQTYDVSPPAEKIIYSDENRSVCSCLSEKRAYFMDKDIRNGLLPKHFCNSEIYFTNGEYHIAYF